MHQRHAADGERAADKSYAELGKMMDDYYAQILKTAQEKGVTLRELTPAEVAAWGEASDYRAELDRGRRSSNKTARLARRPCWQN